MDKQRKTIASRIGNLVVALDTTIRFPRGLIGFENLREFVLVELKAGSPFRFLQSMENPAMGLMVADPFSFLSAYNVRLAMAEERILQVKSVRDLVILVTVTVPKGNPEETILNLTGPVCINVHKRLGLQSPQVGLNMPSRVFLKDLDVLQKKSANL